MNCNEFRNRLTVEGVGRPAGRLEDHRETCAACARFAARLETAGRIFDRHHANLEPDAGFAGRLAAHLPDPRTEILGWAALRLLPASLAIVIGLSLLFWRTAPSADPTSAPVSVETTSTELAAPTDDLLGWLLETQGPGS